MPSATLGWMEAKKLMVPMMSTMRSMANQMLRVCTLTLRMR
jgi:hypothetical protein